METQVLLKKGIGTREPEVLKPANVKIVKVELVEIGEGNKKNLKLVCTCKHPKRQDPIQISGVRYLKRDKVKTSGLWYREDEDGLIQRGTALANLLGFYQVESIEGLKNQEVETDANAEGFLSIKAY